MWEENFGTSASVHLIEGVHLIWAPLTTVVTVLYNVWEIGCYFLTFLRTLNSQCKHLHLICRYQEHNGIAPQRYGILDLKHTIEQQNL